MMELKKNIKLGISLALICLVFVFLGVFAPSFIYQASASPAPEGSASNPILISEESDLSVMRNNINSGIGNKAHYKLTANISLTSDWIPIGTAENPFRGKFDGNGKSIDTVVINSNSLENVTSLGLFGEIVGAEIKNLAVGVKVEVGGDSGELSPLKIGGIAGKALNSIIHDCKVNLVLEGNRSEEITVQGTLKAVQTYKYSGEIVAGGAVGYAQGLNIFNCAITTQINVKFDGLNTVYSYLGGAVGQMNGGEIKFVYVAPSGNLISEISAKNGNLTALSSDKVDVKLYNEKTSSSIVSFGGLIGYALNFRLSAYNNFYSSLYYASSSGSNNEIICGGIIGRLNSNASSQPQDVEYCKYLNISNANFSAFTSAVGNAIDVSYVIKGSNTSFSTMPSLNFYTQGSWKELETWDFNNVWKESSVVSYGGYFFPNLQSFSTFIMSLSQNYLVNYDLDGNYSSGYITLNFATFNGGKYTLIGDLTEKTYYAGETVYIIAKFYNGGNNSLTDFKNYYKFTDWVKDGKVIGNSGGGTINGHYSTDEYGPTVDELDVMVSVLEFGASSDTEGLFGINIEGKSVKLKITLAVDEGTGDETNFGSVYNTIGNQTTTYTEEFIISFEQYQNGVAAIFGAVNAVNNRYIFKKWEFLLNSTENEDYIETTSRQITVELDNSRTSTPGRYYPRVVYDETEGELVAEIWCYFSDNTSEVTVNIIGNGSIIIDEGDPISSAGHTALLINNRNSTFTAVADQGYSFKGWYLNGSLASMDEIYTFSVNSGSTLEARFELIEVVAGTKISGGIIAIIVISSLLFVGLIILIILKIKKGPRNSYKKNYRY